MTSARYEINDEFYLTDILTKEDIPSIVTYLNNPKLIANTLTIPYPFTVSDAETLLESMKLISPKLKRLFIIRLCLTGELVGVCNLSRSSDDTHIAEINYWLGEPFWHRGLMPQVIPKVIEVVSSEWNNLIRIEAHTFPWNKPSGRVLEKTGFLFEAVLRKHNFKNGQYNDGHLYSYIVEK
jgi:ribosomal-protein-alanine N-acetyltransferase